MNISEQYDRLLRYCYMKVRNRETAEDITQESFARYLESENYRESGKEMAYLYTIARNLCYDRFRGNREELSGDVPDDLAAEDGEAALDDRLTIEAALDRLDESDRELVMLRFSGDLRINDIAEMMHISRFAVRRRISAALTKLRKEMEE